MRNFTKIFPLISGLMLGLLLVSGCTPGSRPAPADKPTSPSGQLDLGTFNLQKRHGLGGWDKPAGPTKKQLLQELSKRRPLQAPDTSRKQEEIR